MAVIEKLRKSPGKSLFGALGGRSAAKGAYRMLGNEKFELEKLHNSVQQTTIAGISESEEKVVLLVQDTTDINLNAHKKTKGLGLCSEHVRGLKLHTCVAFTGDGIPLGLMHQQTHTRITSGDEETLSKYEKSKRPVEEKESFRWLETARSVSSALPDGVKGIIVGDRECDFYEFYNEAENLNLPYIIRLVNNRVGEGGEKIKSTLSNSKPAGTISVEVPRDSRNNKKARQADLEITYTEVTINKPKIRKEEHVADQVTMTIIRVSEPNPPVGVDAIEWFLATNLTIKAFEDAVKIVGYYVQRWKIERFHYVLKSGCTVERIQERDVATIKPLILIYSVISLYIMAMTLCGRSCPDLSCDAFFDEYEWKILYCAANKTKTPPTEPYPISQAIKYLGILGCGKKSPSDGVSGLKAVWQGLFALYILEEYAGFVGQV